MNTINPTRNGGDDASTAGLLSRLLNDATALVRNEVALAKAEISRSIADVKVGVGAVATAAIVLLGGFLALVAAAVLGLAEVVDPWLAAVIVGIALGIIGLLMLQAAKKKFTSPSTTLDRTRESLSRDAEVIARRT